MEVTPPQAAPFEPAGPASITGATADVTGQFVTVVFSKALTAFLGAAGDFDISNGTTGYAGASIEITAGRLRIDYGDPLAGPNVWDYEGPGSDFVFTGQPLDEDDPTTPLPYP